jgi:hypothetical protein
MSRCVYARVSVRSNHLQPPKKNKEQKQLTTRTFGTASWHASSAIGSKCRSTSVA